MLGAPAQMEGPWENETHLQKSEQETEPLKPMCICASLLSQTECCKDYAHSHTEKKAVEKSHILATNAQKHSRSVQQFSTRVSHFGPKPRLTLVSPCLG